MPLRPTALALLALALPPLSSGCCTILLWEEGVPELHVEKVLAASVDGSGHLTLAIERSDGDRGLYSYDLLESTSGNSTLARVGSWDGTLPESASPIRVVDGDPALAPDDLFQQTVSAAFTRGRRHQPFELGLPLWVGRRSEGTAVVVLPDPDVLPDPGAGDLWIAWIEEQGETDWSHPGTWGAVVVTPVTAAVDLVTLPFQLIFFCFFMPRC